MLPKRLLGPLGSFLTRSSQAEAEAGTENTKYMTPLRTAQAITAQVAALLDRDVSVAEVTNTAAETSVYSFSVPGGTLSTNKMLRLTLLADYLNNSGAGHGIIIRVKYGATTVLTFDHYNANVLATNASRRSVRIQVELSAAGATNTQKCYGIQFFSDPSGTAGNDIVINNNQIPAAWHDAVAEDSTLAKTLEITAQHDGALSTLSFKAHVVQLELV